MFAKGPQPGATPKEDAMRHLPPGTTCRRVTAMGITGYVIELPDGKPLVSAGNAADAWSKEEDCAIRNPEKIRPLMPTDMTIDFEETATFITAFKSGQVLVRCGFGLTDCRDTESLDAFVARHGGAAATAEYLQACRRA